MASKSFLSRLAEIEVRAFGLGDEAWRGECWVDRERRVLRLYFAMGLTASVTVGAFGLMVLLAVASGPGFERWGWFEQPQATRVVAQHEALPRRSETEWRVAPIDGNRIATTAVAAESPATAAPPFVRVISVMPVDVRKPTAVQAVATAKPVRPRLENAVQQKNVQAPVSVAVASPVAVPLAAIAEPRFEPVVIKRPEGLSALGGPVAGREPAATESPWWRQVWWGPSALRWLQRE